MSGAVAQLGARLDGIEEVVGSNPIGSTNPSKNISLIQIGPGIVIFPRELRVDHRAAI
jgi:hypothetical protein